MRVIILLLILLINLISCASDYPCGEPRSGRCSSVTQNYNNSMHNVVNPEDLPLENKRMGCKAGECSLSSHRANSNINKMINDNRYPQVPENGSPLVSTPSMLRVWYAPYVDNDNIYHDQEYQYMIVDKGHWIYGSNSVYGRGASGVDTPATKLIQSENLNNKFNTEEEKPQQNSTFNNTPALNFLKQQNNANASPLSK